MSVHLSLICGRIGTFDAEETAAALGDCGEQDDGHEEGDGGKDGITGFT